MFLLFLTGNDSFREGQALPACLGWSSPLTGSRGPERLRVGGHTAGECVRVGVWAQACGVVLAAPLVSL